MKIEMKAINAVKYLYNPININNTVKELNIPNGGVITIHLKSTF
jgi:hypothetical protein